MGYTKSQGRASMKYRREHYKQLTIDVTEEERSRYKQAATDAGLSFKQFVIDAMEEKIRGENNNA